MLTTLPLIDVIRRTTPEEEARQAPLLDLATAAGPIIAAQTIGSSCYYWLCSTAEQASLLLALNPKVDPACVWDQAMLSARLGAHTATWTLEQLAAGLFARLGPDPRVTPVPWLRRIRRWLRLQRARLPLIHHRLPQALANATSVDVSTVLSIGAATLLDQLAQATHGKSLDQLDQGQLDQLWKRGNSMVLAARMATCTHTPIKAALLTNDATPVVTSSTESGRGYGMYL
jgi:hypothetical protein